MRIEPYAFVLAVCLPIGTNEAQSFAETLAFAGQRLEAGEAAAALEVLLELQDRAESTDEQESVAATLRVAGKKLLDRSDFAAALRAYNAALALRRDVAGDTDDPLLAEDLSNVGYCLRALGDATAALARLEAALAMYRRLFGDDDHAGAAQSLNFAGNCLQDLGRADDALAHYEAALAMRKRLYGDGDHLDIAVSLGNVAACLGTLGRMHDALSPCEEAVAMLRRLFGDRDHTDVAGMLNNLANCLHALGRHGEALAQLETSLAMHRRLHPEGDHADVALGLNNVAACLVTLGRAAEALPRLEQALAMNQRIFRDGDHPTVAAGLGNVGNCLKELARASEALPLLESQLAMNRRLHGNGDHPGNAHALGNVARCLNALCRDSEALTLHEESLAMYRRIHGDGDHSDVASGLDDVATSLEGLGRSAEALPLYEASLAIFRRLSGDADHPDVASGLTSVASCLESLGRPLEGLQRYEASLAMVQRLHRDRDHPSIAAGLHNVAYCESALGRAALALGHYESSVAMLRRLQGDADDESVAGGLLGIGSCLLALGDPSAALAKCEEGLEMSRRVHPGRDHPTVAAGLNNVARCFEALRRPDEALPLLQDSLEMHRRLYGDRDHPMIAFVSNSVARCLASLGRRDEALRICERTVAAIERLRDRSRVSAGLRQSFFDDLKGGGAFERLQSLAAALGRPADAWLAAERCRGRGLLDLIEEQRFDALEEAERRARLRGDQTTTSRLESLRSALGAAEHDSDRLLQQLTQLDDQELAEEARTARRQELLVQSNENADRRRRLLDERARALGDVLPVGRVRTPAEVQATLQEGELLLQFTMSQEVSSVYVLARAGEVELIDLPAAYSTIARVLPGVLRGVSHQQLATRGVDPEPSGAAPRPIVQGLRELFASLIPEALWARLRGQRRIFVAAHRELHRVPFELLVTGTEADKPVYWIDSGPAVAYVPSGSVLHWLRQRSHDVADDATSLDLLAVGDPSVAEAGPEVPEAGVLVLSVLEGGEGARAGLQSGDVLLLYDQEPLVDDQTLRELRQRAGRAGAQDKRDAATIPVRVWRRGTTLDLHLGPGPLDIGVAVGKARAAHEASLSGPLQLERITRAGEIERIRKLPRLRGARAETEAIERVFAASRNNKKCLLGGQATETSVFELAAKAKFVHFACHGIAEEYAGQSLSMLVLSLPAQVSPTDDGLLKLGDLLQHWRGRLGSCRLVVLSACSTDIGPTLRDEAPQALPIGFLFAGVPSVISSLWAVDDTSTRELMTDFYGRLLAGDTDHLHAFTAAKKALRAKYQDPFHWAPFLYVGCPE